MTSATISGGHYRATGPFAGWFSIQYSGGEFSSRAAISTQQDNVTWEEWIRPEVISANSQPAFGNNAASNGWDPQFATTGKFQVIVEGVAGQSLNANALGLNTWFHIVIKRESTVWKYYLNGVQDTANAGTGTPGASPTSTFIHTGGSFQARHAMTAYYNTALSDARIAAHFAEGSAAVTAASQSAIVILG